MTLSAKKIHGKKIDSTSKGLNYLNFADGYRSSIFNKIVDDLGVDRKDINVSELKITYSRKASDYEICLFCKLIGLVPSETYDQLYYDYNRYVLSNKCKNVLPFSTWGLIQAKRNGLDIKGLIDLVEPVRIKRNLELPPKYNKFNKLDPICLVLPPRLLNKDSKDKMKG